jgi:hypothetical protein
VLSNIVKRSGTLSAIHWWLLQFGFDLRALIRALRELPVYVGNLRRFRRSFNGEIRLRPSLHDRRDTAGAVSSEYFWQDLYVAQKIFKANPARHVDVGSRFDGFIAHLASFRTVEVFDVRPMAVNIPNITFRQADLMQPDVELLGLTPSLSCLHALEHFGLGRYGDSVCVDGHLRGLSGLASLMAPDGVLYLGCPTGKPRVDFDSHRVMDPVQIVDVGRSVGLSLESLVTFASGRLFEEPDTSSAGLREIARREYSLCIYVFRKAA